VVNYCCCAAWIQQKTRQTKTSGPLKKNKKEQNSKVTFLLFATYLTFSLSKSKRKIGSKKQ